MRRLILLAALTIAASAGAQPAPPLAGIWTLDRPASEFPADIGFNPSWMRAPLEDGRGSASTGGGRGRRGSGGAGGGRDASPFARSTESYEDARLLQLLTAEARNPPVRLTIVDTMSAVTMVNELGQTRTLHPDGRQETIELEGVPIGVTTKRDGDQLVVTYRAGQGREIRYTYSPSTNPARLTVDLQFLERGTGDKARRVYQPGTAVPTAAPSAPAGGAAPASGSQPAGSEPIDQRPGAELRGLKSLGILVEDLSAQATACGLSRDAIESALSKPLTDAGFSVRRNSDEDTYVYVNVMTSAGANGTCISRYDAFLYTHGTATLSYRDRPVLVQVSLMHRGGMGVSVPSAHAAAVVRGLAGFVDLFVTQIRDANK
jgi:hypothetical protein